LTVEFINDIGGFWGYWLLTLTRTSKWLVTGGAGFFGAHLCRDLLARGHEVIAYDIETFLEYEKPAGVIEVKGDIRDTARLREAMRGCDYVVHAAAALALADPAEIHGVNAEGTRLVLECSAAEGVKRVIHIGTCAIYGMPKEHPLFETTPLDPMGEYGIAKAKAEEYMANAEGVETVRIRPKSFIGTGRLGIFQILFDWIEHGALIPIFGNGENIFQLLDVRDLCEGVYLAAMKGRDKDVYLIAADRFGTVKADVGALLDHAGTGAGMLHLPSTPLKAICAALDKVKLSPVYRWVYDTADQDSFVSIDKARAELGFQPKYSNQDTLIETYDWYMREGKELAAKATGTSHRTAWRQGVLAPAKTLLSIGRGARRQRQLAKAA
jgi:nucleoside-diphosphate-sugar epimerase